MGDIEAQLAGCLLGPRPDRALADKYGVATFSPRVDDDPRPVAKRAARAKIRAIPDGTYAAESFLDNDGDGDDADPDQGARHRRRRRDDGRLFGHGRASARARSIPAIYGGGQTTARVAFKYLIATDEPANEGTFRPLKLILPAGKLVSAAPTAPMGNYSSPFPTVIDTFIKALEHGAAGARDRRAFRHVLVAAFHRPARRRRAFQCHDSGHGGWGACATHDGAGPFRTMAHGDTRIIPLELQESMYPYRIEEFACARTPAAPATSAAASASANATACWALARSRSTTNASSARHGACSAANPANPAK